MKCFKYIIVILILSSCYTTNKAKKQVSKAHALKPIVTAEMCNSFYPIKDSISYKFEFIQGKNDTTFQVDTLMNSKDSIIYINTIKYIKKTDTIREQLTSIKESTSKDAVILNLSEQKAIIKETLRATKKSLNTWRLSFFILIALYLGKIILTKRIF